MEPTDWIKPGADILVYLEYGDNQVALYPTKVLVVAKQSFTVEAVGTRINLATMASKNTGSGWHPSVYKATRPDSKTARALNVKIIRSRVERAAIAVVGYPIATNPEQLDAAIKALTEWRDYLATEEEK